MQPAEPVCRRSRATHSTWWVIGNRSKARSRRGGSRARRRSRRRGRARPGRRRRRRPPRGRRATTCSTTARLAPVRGGSRTTRSTGRRQAGASTRPTSPASTSAPGHVGARVPARLGGPPRPAHDPARTDRVGEEPGEEADPGVEVEDRLAGPRRQRSSTVRPASRGRPGGPARSRSPRRPRRHPAHEVRTARRAGDQAVVDAATTSCERCLRIPRPPSGSGRTAGGSASAARPGRPGTGSTVDVHVEPASRENCSRTTSRLERPLPGERDVLEVAAAARVRAGVRAGRRDPVGRRLEHRDRVGAPEPVALGALGDLQDHRSPGCACRTKTTRASGRRSRATQCPPWATGPTSASNRPHPGRAARRAAAGMRRRVTRRGTSPVVAAVVHVAAPQVPGRTRRSSRISRSRAISEERSW